MEVLSNELLLEMILKVDDHTSTFALAGVCRVVSRLARASFRALPTKHDRNDLRALWFDQFLRVNMHMELPFIDIAVTPRIGMKTTPIENFIYVMLLAGIQSYWRTILYYRTNVISLPQLEQRRQRAATQHLINLSYDSFGTNRHHVRFICERYLRAFSPLAWTCENSYYFVCPTTTTNQVQHEGFIAFMFTLRNEHMFEWMVEQLERNPRDCRDEIEALRYRLLRHTWNETFASIVHTESFRYAECISADEAWPISRLDEISRAQAAFDLETMRVRLRRMAKALYEGIRVFEVY
jgi:hypothetical protein